MMMMTMAMTNLSEGTAAECTSSSEARLGFAGTLSLAWQRWSYDDHCHEDEDGEDDGDEDGDHEDEDLA